MPEYDFSTLSPHDFELLSRDLLQEELAVTLESFKSGRDQGIDLRFSKPKDNSALIVQCKHYQRSGFSMLKSTLKKDELPKIKKLKPRRYLLTTSVSLSSANKNDLLAILAPHCCGPADILGKEDLNNLLGKHERIERKHFKLWLPSTEVLQRLLSNGVFTQTDLEIDEIKRQLSLFVPTPAVDRGKDMLQKNGFCMLTGIPGIGKTATARILVAHHIEENWEGIYLSSDVSHAFDVFRPEDKQIFFYDDFLGQTSLQEKLVKNEDRRLLQLVHACQKTPKTKRLVLTTREYLFEQAKQQHEILSRSNIELAECTVKLSDYTEKIRAQILVNHLYFYGINAEVCSQFVESGTAKATLKHDNYNPRIIETMCEMQQTSDYSSDEFASRFIEMLNSPEEIWKHAYENQLSKSARQLLLVFAILGKFTTVDAMRNEFRIYVEHSELELVGFDAMFNSSLEELEGNYISIHVLKQLSCITYHTPSIKDFTDEQLKHEDHFLRLVLKNFSYDETLISAAELLIENRPTSVIADEFLDAMQRGDFRTSYKLSAIGQFLSKKKPVDRAQTLRSWLYAASTLNNEKAMEATVECVEEFFRNVTPESDQVSLLIDLYGVYLLAVDSTKPNLTPVDFAELIAEHCEDPDDFVSLSRLLEDCEGSEEFLSRLQASFPDKVYDWLDSVVDSVNSSDEAYGAIDSVSEAAKALGHVVDIESHQERAQEMERHEEVEADMREDDYSASRYEERQESEEIDDILDSLRG